MIYKLPRDFSYFDYPPDTYYVLAEGDSWFHLGGLTTSLLWEILKLLEKKHGKVAYMNLAKSGDTAAGMGSPHSFAELRKALYMHTWDAVLVSAGGNDIIEAVKELTRSNAANAQLARTLAYKTNRYLNSVKALTSAPVYTHNYAALVPLYDKKFLRAGPWLGSALLESDYCGTVKRFQEEYNKHLSTKVIDTYSNVKILPDWYKSYWRGDKNGYWRNEIHPSVKGYRKLAEYFVSFMQ